MNKLIDILKQLKPDVDFERNERLVDDDVLDSFDIVAIIGQINETYDIEVGVEDILPENFNSAKAMFDLVNRLSE